MSTKDYSLSSNSKSGTGKTSKYSNLNLNKDHKCSNDFSLTSKNAKNETKSIPAFNDHKNDRNNSLISSWNKRDKQKNFYMKDSDSGKDDEKWNGSMKAASTSTISLYISAYENLHSSSSSNSTITTTKSPTKEELKAKWEKCKKALNNSSLNLQSQFEVPRQQENECKNNVPEIMQFKASQKLLNPNQSANSEQPPIDSLEAETTPVCADLGTMISAVGDPPEDSSQVLDAHLSEENEILMNEILALTRALQIDDANDPNSDAFDIVKIIYRDLPQHRGTKIVIGNITFTIEDLLNDGSTGIVYRVSDDSGVEYAIKVSRLIRNANFVKEMKTAKAASDSGMIHFCSVAAVGWVPERYMFIVMTLLGPSIYDVCQKYGKLMPSSALILAKQALQGIENLHKLGFIHRDVTPSNFALGVDDHRHTLYIIDFDTCSCVPSEVLDEAPSNENDGFIGTLQYASIAALNKQKQSQKDDLEGWLQVIVEIWNGTAFPWKDNEAIERIIKRKQGYMYSEAGFIKKFMPAPFDRIAKYIRALKYGECPDYEKLHKFIDEIYLCEGVKKPRAIEWDSDFIFSGPANVPLDNDQAYYISSSSGFNLMHNGDLFVKSDHPSPAKGQKVFQCAQTSCRGLILVDEFVEDEIQNYQIAVILNVIHCHSCGKGQISKEHVRAQLPKTDGTDKAVSTNATDDASDGVEDEPVEFQHPERKDSFHEAFSRGDTAGVCRGQKHHIDHCPPIGEPQTAEDAELFDPSVEDEIFEEYLDKDLVEKLTSENPLSYFFVEAWMRNNHKKKHIVIRQGIYEFHDGKHEYRNPPGGARFRCKNYQKTKNNSISCNVSIQVLNFNDNVKTGQEAHVFVGQNILPKSHADRCKS